MFATLGDAAGNATILTALPTAETDNRKPAATKRERRSYTGTIYATLPSRSGRRRAARRVIASASGWRRSRNFKGTVSRRKSAETDDLCKEAACPPFAIRSTRSSDPIR